MYIDEPKRSFRRFHPDIARSKRYRPLNMLLAYDAELVPEEQLRKSKLRPLDHFLAHLDVGVDEQDAKGPEDGEVRVDGESGLGQEPLRQGVAISSGPH